MRIKRNPIDFLITDTLPIEISGLFTYSYFYQYLVKKENKQGNELGLVKQDLKVQKANNSKLFCNGWASTPLKFHIEKSKDSSRVLSIVQPLACINMMLFISSYENEISCILNKSSFSLRKHRSSNKLYFSRNINGLIGYRGVKNKERVLIEQNGSYFDIGRYRRLDKYFSSNEWQTYQAKFRYFLRIDFQSCFDSIYTHSFGWSTTCVSVERIGLKETSMLHTTLDRVLQNINGRVTNGIVVGPEFSRLSAEIILQDIDNNVEKEINQSGLVFKTDYVVSRFVDDIFIFTKSIDDERLIFDAFTKEAQKYGLRINEKKILRIKTPFIISDWVTDMSQIANVIDNSINADEGKLVISLEYNDKKKIIDHLTNLVTKFPDKKKSIISYILTIFFKRISQGYIKSTDIYIDSKTKKELSDLLFYLMANSPVFNNIERFISIIYLLEKPMELLEKPEFLASLFDQYSFIFFDAYPHDYINLLLLCCRYDISLKFNVESSIKKTIIDLKDPLLLATFFVYAWGTCDQTKLVVEMNDIVFNEVGKIAQIDKAFEYSSFWYVLVFNKCPFLKGSTSQDQIDILLNGIKSKLGNPRVGNSNIVKGLIIDYQILSNKQFIDWKYKESTFSDVIYQTYSRTIFDNGNAFISGVEPSMF